MCSLRDAAEELAEYEVKIYGISSDDVDAMARFAKAEGLEFDLLSDPDGSAIEKFGVGRKGRPTASRVTFVIDDEGVIRHIDKGVKVDSHGTDLVEVIAELQG